jgi:hypothetical protein
MLTLKVHTTEFEQYVLKLAGCRKPWDSGGIIYIVLVKYGW